MNGTNAVESVSSRTNSLKDNLLVPEFYFLPTIDFPQYIHIWADIESRRDGRKLSHLEAKEHEIG